MRSERSYTVWFSVPEVLRALKGHYHDLHVAAMPAPAGAGKVLPPLVELVNGSLRISWSVGFHANDAAEKGAEA